MGFAAVLMVVPGTLAAGGDLISPGAAAVGAATGVLSSVIPYSLELEALRRIAVGTFGVLMSMEPAGRRADRADRTRPGARHL